VDAMTRTFGANATRSAKGAGNTAFDVTEELGLEQCLRNAGAIDRHECRVRAKARRTYRPGNDLLARV